VLKGGGVAVADCTARVGRLGVKRGARITIAAIERFLAEMKAERVKEKVGKKWNSDIDK
jgi:hypothetical protein